MSEDKKTTEAQVRIELGPHPPQTTKIFINDMEITRSCLGFKLEIENSGPAGWLTVLTLRMYAKNAIASGSVHVQVEPVPFPENATMSERTKANLLKGYEAIETEAKA